METIYSEAGFLRTVLTNDNLNFKAKLIFIKYMEKIRLSAVKPEEHTMWKEKY